MSNETLRPVPGDAGHIRQGERYTSRTLGADQSSANSALNFYLERIGQFDNERKVFVDYEKLIIPKKSEMHMLEWEIKQEKALADEKSRELVNIEQELQRLTDQCTDEKAKLAQMRKSQVSRQQQIERLAELTQPVQHDTTYIVIDRHPKKVEVTSDSAPVSPRPASTSTAGHSYLTKQYRTGEILMLERLLEDETKKVYSGMSTFELNARDAMDKISKKGNFSDAVFAPGRNEAMDLIEELDSLDRQCFLAVTELLSLRLRVMTAQREETEELDCLRKDREYFAVKEAQAVEQLRTDMVLMKQRLQTEVSTSTTDLQHQLKSLNEQISLLEQREVETAEELRQMTEKNVKLATQAATSRDRYERLRRRYALEMEGYENEAKMLRSKLKQLQKQVKVGKDTQRPREIPSTDL